MENRRINIYVKKLKEVENPLHPNNIAEGFESNFVANSKDFEKPIVGKAFWACNWWRTSPVVEVIDDNTFRTLNSIYHWEIKS